ncbi:MAG TPA: glycosyltransferase family 4 protein [Acidobacteriota bacterium]|nr:glycosyltransferase family 4 protein [Acidobacteriota bacterium]
MNPASRLDLQCLIASPEAPAFDRQSGDRRLYHLILLLREAGARVRFWAHDQREASPYLQRLQEQEIECFTGPEAAREALASPPDLVLTAFWKLTETLLPLVRARFPRCRVMADSVDLHLLRRSREALLGEGLLHPEDGINFISELNTYACCDGVLAVSEKEASLIGDLLGRRQGIHTVPDYEEPYADAPPLSQRRGLIFLGNHRHQPNCDAVSWLLEEIVPLLGESLLADHPLRILGHGTELPRARSRGGPIPPPFKLRNPNLVLPLGWVDDVKPLLASSRLSLAPLRFGAGTKRKVIESLLCGTPCVCTPVAAEGLGLEHEREVLIAGDAPAFAQAVKRLLQEDDLWRRLSESGREALQERHSPERARERLTAAVREVLSRPPQSARRARQARSRRDHWMKSQYQHLLLRLRLTASQELNGEARLAVISRGDDDMLGLGLEHVVHFPCDSSGRPLWHHPADSASAIELLQKQRQDGLTHLLIPSTAFWWLEHYGGFADWLESHARLLHYSPDTCRIYELTGPGEAA